MTGTSAGDGAPDRDAIRWPRNRHHAPEDSSPKLPSTGTSTIDAYPDFTGCRLIILCPHCGSEHYHTRHRPGNGCENRNRRSRDSMKLLEYRCTCPVGTGDGLRRAHCADTGSPFYSIGYGIREVPMIPRHFYSQEFVTRAYKGNGLVSLVEARQLLAGDVVDIRHIVDTYRSPLSEEERDMMDKKYALVIGLNHLPADLAIGGRRSTLRLWWAAGTCSGRHPIRMDSDDPVVRMDELSKARWF